MDAEGGTWASSLIGWGVRSYPVWSPYPIVTNFGMGILPFKRGPWCERLESPRLTFVDTNRFRILPRGIPIKANHYSSN